MSEAILTCPWCGHPQSEHPTVGGCSHRWTDELCACRKTLLEVTQAIELERERQMLDKALADLEKATNDNERLRGLLANAIAAARGKYTAYELEILLGKEAETCGWKEQDGFCTSGTWNTDCGEDFIFETGTPKENGLIFCPYCGRPLVEINDLDETEQEGEE